MQLFTDFEIILKILIIIHFLYIFGGFDRCMVSICFTDLKGDSAGFHARKTHKAIIFITIYKQSIDTEGSGIFVAWDIGKYFSI